MAALSIAPSRAQAACTPGTVPITGAMVDCTGANGGLTLSNAFYANLNVRSGASLSRPTTDAESAVVAINDVFTSRTNVDGTISGAIDGDLNDKRGYVTTGSGSRHLSVRAGGSVLGNRAVYVDGNALRLDISNRGRISGTEGGPAVIADGTARLELINHATGVVTGDLAGNIDRVANSGRINGSIAAHRGGSEYYHRTGGILDGELAFFQGTGAGNKLWIEYRDGTAASGIDLGRVTAGAGTQDVFGYRVTGSGASTLLFGALPTGFDRYGLDLCGCGLSVTVTAAGAAPLAAPIDVTGHGSVDLRADLNLAELAGPGLSIAGNGYDHDGEALVVRNSGTISIARPGDSGILVDSADGESRLVNDGQINVALGSRPAVGIAVEGHFLANDAALINSASGRIAISGTGNDADTAVRVRNGRFENAGQVAITGSGSGNIELDAAEFRNSGSISGNTAGAMVNASISRITNALGGTIANSDAAREAIVAERSVVRNDGTINGNVAGATSAVSNRGTINGNLQMQGGYVHLAEGSTITGNLTLAEERMETLVLDTSRLRGDGIILNAAQNGAPQLYSNLFGRDLVGNRDRLFLQANSSRSVDVLAPAVRVGGFGTIAYEASGADTVLTLHGPRDSNGNLQNMVDRTLNVLGDGTVVLDASTDLILNAAQGPGAVGIDVLEGATNRIYDLSTRSLHLILRGDVIANNSANSGGFRAVNAFETDRLTIEGKIAIAPGAGTAVEIGEGTMALTGPNSGITIGDSDAALGILARGGSIELGGNSGIQEVGVTSGGRATGVEFIGGGSITLKDSADIRVDGTAILSQSGGPVSVTTANIGNDIVSYTGSALDAFNSFGLTLRNAGGAVIQGAGSTTIRGASFGGDVIVNGGEIIGNVATYGRDDAYITERPAAGGYQNRIVGNLDLGTGNDMALTRDGTHNVTGTLAGGGDIDAIGRSYQASATHALDDDDVADTATRTGFEMHAIEALNGLTVGTTVTLAGTGITRGVRLTGDGTIVNTAAIAANGTNAFETATVLGSTLAFRNQASISSTHEGVVGDLRAFDNSGVISSALNAVAVNATDPAESFSFRNSGSLLSTAAVRTAYVEASAHRGGITADIVNSGTIRNDSDEAVVGSATRALQIEADGAVRLANNGASALIRGGTAIEMSALAASLLNEGTIVATGPGGAFDLQLGSGIVLDPADCLPDGTLASLLSLDNAGLIQANAASDGPTPLISGTAAVRARLSDEMASVTIRNRASATIEASGPNGAALIIQGVDSDRTDQQVASAITLTNEGTIRGSRGLASAGNEFTGGLAGAGQFVEGSYRVGGAISLSNSNDILVNTAGAAIFGDIVLGAGNDRVENNGLIDGDVYLGEGDDSYVLTTRGTIAAGRRVFGGEGFDFLTVGGDDDFAIDGSVFSGFEALAFSGNKTLSGSFDVCTIGVDGGTITVPQGTTLTTTCATTITGGARADTVRNFGAIAGGVSLGGGDDLFVSGVGSTVGGPLDGGSGNDRLEFALQGDATGLPNVLNFESYTVTGSGTLSLGLSQDLHNVQLVGTGLNLTATNGFGIGSISGSDGAESVTLAAGAVVPVALGGGNDTLNLTLAGAHGATLDGGAGTDLFNLALQGDSTLSGTVAGWETINVSGSAPLSVTGSIAAGQNLVLDGSDNRLIVATANFLANADGGAGNDVLELRMAGDRTLAPGQYRNFEQLAATGLGTLTMSGANAFGAVTLSGGANLTLGADASLTASTLFDDTTNTLTLRSGATLVGAVDGGAGIDTLSLVQDGGFVRQLSSLNAAGFERLATSGAGELRIDRNATFDLVTLGGGTTTIAGGATLAAPVLGSASAETLAVVGTLNGSVDLGAGDDRLVLGSLTAVSGTRQGGAGTDTLEFRTSATAAAPTSFNGLGFAGFENLVNTSGALTLTGNQSWANVAVQGGRLTGASGSALTSSTPILVSQSATFGSGGTVNASIDVRGTLAPGADTGTMTVNGNVSLGTGSTLALGLTPTLRDQLAVSGQLSIAQGATLDLTGTTASTPGGVIDLVIANGGITGSFATINRAPGIFGFLAQNANRIQLRGEFQTATTFAGNVQNAIGYANRVLASNQAVQAFTDALPRLVDAQGASNALAFGQLSPEAYATADRIGTEQALLLTDTMRLAARAVPAGDGFFAIGQAFGGWRKQVAEADVTTGSDQIDGAGLIGGLGYSRGGTRFGAFLGNMTADQKSGPLAATTDADGLVIGAFGETRIAGAGLHLMVAAQKADQRTERSLLATQGVAIGDYKVRTTVADASIDYPIGLSDALTLAPRVGMTYVRTNRAATQESSAGGFALAVDGAKHDALYGDGALTLSGSFDLRGVGARPYLEAGVRTRLSGDLIAATARFAGVTGAERMVAAAPAVDKTSLRIGAGVGLDLAPSVSLNTGYSYETANQGQHQANVGLSWRF